MCSTGGNNDRRTERSHQLLARLGQRIKTMGDKEVEKATVSNFSSRELDDSLITRRAVASGQGDPEGSGLVENLPGKETEEAMRKRTWEEMVKNPEAVSEEDFNEMGDALEEAWRSRADLFHEFRKAGLCGRFLYLVFPHWFCDNLYRRIK